MALLSSLYTLTLPLVLFLAIPLVTGAIVTSFFAFSILAFRVVIIYFELAVAVIPYYLTPKLPQLDVHYYNPGQLSTSTATSPTSPARRRRRLSSISISSGAISSSSITPVPSSIHLAHSSLALHNSVGSLSATPSLPVKGLRASTSLSSIKSNPLALPSTHLNPYLHRSTSRDFEGVGGWRLDSPDDGDALWTRINDRLELPGSGGTRRHRRSTTVGSAEVETFRQENKQGLSSNHPSTAQKEHGERETTIKSQGKWSGSGIWASRSTSPETEKVKVSGREREKESNVGRVRSSLENAPLLLNNHANATSRDNYILEKNAVTTGSTSPKHVRKTSGYAVSSGSGSSKNSSVLSAQRT